MPPPSETSISETRPPSPAQAPHRPDLSHRLRRLGVSGRRLRRGWTHERTIEIIQTLAWTIPLTLLLWVWAQDQQVDEQSLTNINLTVNHVDPQRIAMALVSGSLGGETQLRAEFGPTPITVTVRGPRAGVVEAFRPLRERSNGLNLEIDGDPADRTTIDLRQRLNELPEFVEAGVTVVEVSPPTLEVRVDRLISVQVPVVAGYGPLAETEVVGVPVFEPALVTIRGPSRALVALEQAAGSDGLRVVATFDAASAVGEQKQSLRVQLPPELPERLLADGLTEVRNLNIEPDLVTARFIRRDREFTELELAVVPLTIDKPVAMEGPFIVKLQDADFNRLVNVKIRGPKDLIDQLASANGASGIKARLKITADDRRSLDQPVTRQVIFELPPDVELVEEAPTVTFVLEQASP